MAVSAETKAIIDTLKAEGAALREGTGPNSIATMNHKLDRLTGVLEAVAKNIQTQTKTQEETNDRSEEQAERERLQREKDSLKQEKSQQTEKKEKVNLAKEIKTAIPNMLKGLQRTLGNFLLGGIGALALGGFVTGIADTLTKGGFSKFISDFIGGDWESLRANLSEGGYGFTDTINKMLTFATRLAPGGDLHDNITGFIDAIAPVTQWLLDNPMLGLGAVIGGGMLLKGAMRGLSRVLMRTAGKVLVGGLAALGTGLLNSLPGSKTKTPTSGYDELDPRAKTGAAQAEADARLRAAEAERAKVRAQAEADLKARRTLTPDQLDALAGRGKYAIPDSAAARAATAAAGGKGPTVMSDAPKVPNIAFTADDGTKLVTTSAGRVVEQASPQGQMIRNMSSNLTDLDVPGTKITGSVAAAATESAADRAANGKALAKAARSVLRPLIAKKVAGAVLKAIPILGVAAGAWFAATSLAKGDTTTAALEGGSIFLPSLTGVPVDIMAVATSVFFDVYGVPYNQADPTHRELMKDIGEMVAEEFEKMKEDTSQAERIAYDEGTSEMRAALLSKGELGQMGYDPMTGTAVGITPGMATGLGGVTVRTDGGIPKMYVPQTNEEFFASMQNSPYRVGSAANLAMHEEMAAARAAGGATVIDNSVTNNIMRGGDQVTNSTNEAQVVFGEGSGSRDDPYGIPGPVQGGGGGGR